MFGSSRWVLRQTFVLPSAARQTVCLLCPGWSRVELSSPRQRLLCCSWSKTPNTPTSRRCLLQLLSVCLLRCVIHISLTGYSKGKQIWHITALRGLPKIHHYHWHYRPVAYDFVSGCSQLACCSDHNHVWHFFTVLNTFWHAKIDFMLSMLPA